MKELKPVDRDLISELIRNSRLSDRELAKRLGVSQPTVSRRRAALEKEGLLKYSAFPDLKKLGFEILALTLAKWSFNKERRIDERREFVAKHPNIVFTSTGTGLGHDRVCISIHKDYSDYTKLIQELKAEFGQYYEAFSSFIVSLQSDDILRHLTFEYLAELLKHDKTQE
jgi:DNA-binding Lrp family transcriptional regulator